MEEKTMINNSVPALAENIIVQIHCNQRDNNTGLLAIDAK
jgi:hypothetical protein